MNDPEILLSVIVPVYNVEPYIKKCLDSIISQTYKNLEIILVDDGSTDKSGIICDEYALKDSRITVIHKRNGGLSDARNVAIDIAEGDYLSFVDSDDWIDLRMFEVMLMSAKKNMSDIVVCGHNVVYADGGIEPINMVKENVVYGLHEALEYILEDKVIFSFAWDKIYRRKLFYEIRYPIGRIFEDIATTYKLFDRAERVCHINDAFYYYFRREDSLCLIKDEKVAVRRGNDNFQAFYERYTFVKKNIDLKKVMPFCANMALRGGIDMLHGMVRNPSLFSSDYFDITVRKLRNIDIRKNNLVKKSDRIEYILLNFSRHLYRLLLWTYYKLLCRNYFKIQL